MNDRVSMTAAANPHAWGEPFEQWHSPNALAPALMPAGDRLAELADLLALALVRLRSRESPGIACLSGDSGEVSAGLRGAAERASERDELSGDGT